MLISSWHYFIISTYRLTGYLRRLRVERRRRNRINKLPTKWWYIHRPCWVILNKYTQWVVKRGRAKVTWVVISSARYCTRVCCPRSRWDPPNPGHRDLGRVTNSGASRTEAPLTRQLFGVVSDIYRGREWSSPGTRSLFYQLYCRIHSVVMVWEWYYSWFLPHEINRPHSTLVYNINSFNMPLSRPKLDQEADPPFMFHRLPRDAIEQATTSVLYIYRTWFMCYGKA